MVEKLELALDEKGWTQSALEKAAMLSANRISKWKNGTGEPTAKQALRMARLLEMPLEYLIDDEQAEPGGAPVSDREKQVWEAIRTLGVDEAWRRLLQAPTGQPQQVVESRPVYPAGAGNPQKKDAG